MPRGVVKRNRALSNIPTHHVVYGMLVDFRLSRAQDVMAFMSNVLDSNPKVENVIWISLPLISFFRQQDDDLRNFNAADKIIEDNLRRIMTDWKAHPLGPDPEIICKGEVTKRYAALKLIVFPAHGAKPGQQEEGCLLWSCEGSSEDDYLPQRHEVLLHQAASCGFDFVILNYCYSGNSVLTIPRVLNEAVDIERYNVTHTLQVVSFLGVRYSGTDPLLGRSHVESYLRQGAPIGEKNKKIKKGMVVRAELTVHSAQIGRGGRAIPILTCPHGCIVLGGASSGDSEPDQDEQLNERLEMERDEKDSLWIAAVSQMSPLEIKSICARLRKGDHVRVAWLEFLGSTVVHASRGWVAQGADRMGNGVRVCYSKRDVSDWDTKGERLMEDLPPNDGTIIKAIEVAHGA